MKTMILPKSYGFTACNPWLSPACLCREDLPISAGPVDRQVACTLTSWDNSINNPAKYASEAASVGTSRAARKYCTALLRNVAASAV